MFNFILNNAMKEKAKRIKMILFDVDGVMTDGGIILGSQGIELKKFHVQDGMGFTLAKKAGLMLGIITGRYSDLVTRRAMELNADEICQGVFNKLTAYENILEKYGLCDEEVAYVGDDILDIPVLRRVGFKFAVANAVEEVKAMVDYITHKKGGEGAIREVIDLILELKGIRKEVVDYFSNLPLESA